MRTFLPVFLYTWPRRRRSVTKIAELLTSAVWTMNSYTQGLRQLSGAGCMYQPICLALFIAPSWAVSCCWCCCCSRRAHLLTSAPFRKLPVHLRWNDGCTEPRYWFVFNVHGSLCADDSSRTVINPTSKCYSVCPSGSQIQDIHFSVFNRQPHTAIWRLVSATVRPIVNVERWHGWVSSMERVVVVVVAEGGEQRTRDV